VSYAQSFSCGIWQFEESVINFIIYFCQMDQIIPVARTTKIISLESSLISFFFFLPWIWNGTNGELSTLLERLLLVGCVCWVGGFGLGFFSSLCISKLNCWAFWIQSAGNTSFSLFSLQFRMNVN